MPLRRKAFGKQLRRALEILLCGILSEHSADRSTAVNAQKGKHSADISTTVTAQKPKHCK